MKEERREGREGKGKEKGRDVKGWGERGRERWGGRKGESEGGRAGEQML